MLIKYICDDCKRETFLTVPKNEVLCTKCNKPMRKETGKVSTSIDSIPEARFMSDEALYGQIAKGMGYKSNTSVRR